MRKVFFNMLLYAFDFAFACDIISQMTRSNSLGNSTDRLGEGKILPLVFKLTIPAVIAQLITFLYNVVDRMFVAKIDGAGMDALAALGIVLPITLIIQAFAGLIGLGAAPHASIKLGEGNKKESDKIFNTSLVLLLIVGIVISLLTYFLQNRCVLRSVVLKARWSLQLHTSKSILSARCSYCLHRGSTHLSPHRARR